MESNPLPNQGSGDVHAEPGSSNIDGVISTDSLKTAEGVPMETSLSQPETTVIETAPGKPVTSELAASSNLDPPRDVLDGSSIPALEVASVMSAQGINQPLGTMSDGASSETSALLQVASSTTSDVTDKNGAAVHISEVSASISTPIDPSSEKTDPNLKCRMDQLNSSVKDTQVKSGGVGNKRPKSPQASSSAETAVTSSSNMSVDVSDSMHNLSLSNTDQVPGEGEATTTKSKKKRKKKKKKKVGEEVPSEAAEADGVSLPSGTEASPVAESGNASGGAAARGGGGTPSSERGQSAKGSEKAEQAEGSRPPSAKAGVDGRPTTPKGKQQPDDGRGTTSQGEGGRSAKVSKKAKQAEGHGPLSAKAGADGRPNTPKGKQESDNNLQQKQSHRKLQDQHPHHQQQQQGQQQHPRQQQRQQRNLQQSQQQQGGDRVDGQQQMPASEKKKKKHHDNRKHFEPYWTVDKVSEGLKRGTIFQGRIRINPKNYEDAYVPLPDGSADIYIPGMTNRNRALEGDIVAVQVEDRENWRVYSNQLDYYEQQNTPAPTEETDNKQNDTEGDAAAGVAGMNVDDRPDENDDNSPDVVIEEEEVTELDSNGQPVSTKITKPLPSEAKLWSQKGVTPDNRSQQKCGQSGKSTDSPGSSRNRQRYISVKDVMNKGSLVARQLFTQKGAAMDGEETRGVNMDKFMQKTGKVVAIIEKKHSRACSGSLRPMQDNNPNCALFSPTDSRIPRIIIQASGIPPGFKERPGDFASVLFIARITEWHETSKMPKGTLAQSLGEAGKIEPQTEALLIENDVDDSEFSEEVLACLPQDLPWSIPASEFEYRRDFRSDCVFTIDPSTARDLDDALSCRSLGDGLYEVGVHIADVSYFVTEGTKLDKVAQSRATSVYLVQKVIPMLPRLLCEQLCSLNPDEDRLTFSVVWKMTESGEIVEEWFGRSVIRSCVKLSYDHAQGFINEPDRAWTPEELPSISNGFTVEDIKSRVLRMDKMAQAMRKARFDEGALRLDQLKIQFTLDKDSGMPNGYFVYEQRDSNKLVEEFMLLANMAVAHKIKKSYQDKALLRRHPPPQSRMIEELKETCASLGFCIEVDTAKDIQRSLQKYTGEDELSKARMQVLVVLCSKPMQNAKYFCCGVLADEAMYRHYALSVPLYTHFTSPIRRYPDVLVHRTLAAALGYCEVTGQSSIEIQNIAEYCNRKKANAKRASELSNEVYFSVFVQEAGPLEEKGMVMNVLDKSFDVYVLKLGVVKRVYCEKLLLESFSHIKEGKRPVLTMVWKVDDGCPYTVTQKISIFSSVNCVLKSEAEPLKWSATIKRPLPGDPTCIQ